MDIPWVDVPFRERLIVSNQSVRLSYMPTPTANALLLITDKDNNIFQRNGDFSAYAHLEPDELKNYVCVLDVSELGVADGDSVVVDYARRFRRDAISFVRDKYVDMEVQNAWVNSDLLEVLSGSEIASPSYDDFAEVLS